MPSNDTNTIEAPEEYDPRGDDNNWVTVTCRNHPELRWTMKNPTIDRISRNLQLMFDGDTSTVGRHDPKVWPYPLPRLTKAYPQQRPVALHEIQSVVDRTISIHRSYIVECSCPFDDLYIIGSQDGNGGNRKGSL
jgi:hypothetical protein